MLLYNYHSLVGKGSEDKRGQAVLCNGPEKSWLYLTPVGCTHQMAVAAMVTAINPAISSTADSLDMAVLQQVLCIVITVLELTALKSFLEVVVHCTVALASVVSR